MNKGLEALERNKYEIENADDFLLIKKELKGKEELEKAFDTLSKDHEKAMKELSLEIEKNRALSTIVQIFDVKVGKNKLGQCFVSSTSDIFAISQETYDLLKSCCYDIRND